MLATQVSVAASAAVNASYEVNEGKEKKIDSPTEKKDDLGETHSEVS